MDKVFSKLGVPENLKLNVYVAALLSCWLCAFVFLNHEEKIIRPGTFKPSCVMTSGRKVGLAIPVLTSIYRRLNNISKSTNPGTSKSYFPAHYIYVWMAHYFGTHFLLNPAPGGPKMTAFFGEGGSKYYTDQDARALIHSGNNFNWNALSFSRNDERELLNDGTLRDSQLRILYYVRSSLLTLRCGDSFIVEPYNPHRFSR